MIPFVSVKVAGFEAVNCGERQRDLDTDVTSQDDEGLAELGIYNNRGICWCYECITK